MTGTRKVSTGLLTTDCRGFTLVEVAAVLILLGIIAAVAISRATSVDDARAMAEIDTLKGHLRFAQYRAMNDEPSVRWGINVTNGSYTLVKKVGNNEPTSPLFLPGESSASHTFADGVSGSVTGNNPVLFNEWGSPGDAAATITVGGKTITVNATTGYIP